MLDRSQFMWADLTRARLEPRTFEGANFQCANLQGVNISTYGRENDMKRLAVLLEEEAGSQARDMGAYFKLKRPESSVA